MEMIVNNVVGAGTSTLEVAVPALAKNAHGEVYMHSLPGNLCYANIRVVVVDLKLKAAGITSIRSVRRIATGAQGEYVACDTNKGERGLLLADRDWLRELIINRDQIASIMDGARENFWKKQRADYAANVERPLLAAMQAQAVALRAQIPVGAIEILAQQIGDADGDPIMRYTADGVEISWQDVEIVGTASAVRPGALGAFAAITVAYTYAEKITTKIAADSAAAAKRAVDKQELLTTVIPTSALASYRRYHGDAEAAWEAGDETDWAAINNWSPYIEAQGKGSLRAIARQMQEAAKEQPLDD
jgi:hypothetical protein